MTEISVQELVVTCESCQTVKKIPIKEYEDCEQLFQAYECPNGCGRNLYSYFTVGHVRKKVKS